MTIKKEMERKEKNINFAGEGIDYDKGEREYGGYVDLDLYTKGKDGNMKKVDPKIRIDKLEKCVRNKDKRIKKIEDYFKLRNRLIVSVCWSLLFVIPWLLFFLYAERVLDDSIYPITIVIFSAIGVTTLIVGPIYIWVSGMEKIWGDW